MQKQTEKKIYWDQNTAKCTINTNDISNNKNICETNCWIASNVSSEQV